MYIWCSRSPSHQPRTHTSPQTTSSGSTFHWAAGSLRAGIPPVGCLTQFPKVYIKPIKRWWYWQWLHLCLGIGNGVSKSLRYFIRALKIVLYPVVNGCVTRLILHTRPMKSSSDQQAHAKKLIRTSAPQVNRCSHSFLSSWKMAPQLLDFELSPPWHLYVLLLANLLAFYLTYLLAFYLAYLLAFYLAYLLAFYLAYLLQYFLAYLLALYLAYLLTFYLAFYLANLLAFYLANILALYLAYRHTFWHSIWHIFWHFIWHIFWHIFLAYLLAYHLANLMAFYMAYLLAFYLTFYLAYLLAFYLAFEVQRCALNSEGPRLRSSGAHWARQVPGWGPAVRTELGRSQVEVQRCALS